MVKRYQGKIQPFRAEQNFNYLTRTFWQCAVALWLFCINQPLANQAFSVQTGATDGPRPANSPTILLMLGVVWDGTIGERHLDSLEELRSQFPAMPVTHFINPNHFFLSRPMVDARNLALHQHLRPQDSTALFLVPNREIVSAAGVIFRRGPTFWGYELGEDECYSECGQDMPLTIYTQTELEQLTRAALEGFQRHNIRRPSGFLANGWLSNANLRKIIAEHDINHDFSAIPPALFGSHLQGYPLFDWLLNQWSNVTPYTQPQILTSPAGTVTQITNNGAAFDYLTPTQLTDLFHSFVQLSLSYPQQTLVFQVNAHLATLDRLLPRAQQTLEGIFSLAQTHKINIIPVTVDQQQATDRTTPGIIQAH